MRNLSFVIWTIGWPLAYDIEKHLYFLQTSKEFVTPNGFIFMISAIWLGVAVLLYERKQKRSNND